MIEDLDGVELVHWNPRRNRVPVLRRFELGRRVNNFGDLLGPIVASRLHRRARIGHPQHGSRRLLTIGSIMHIAEEGDTVWGSGVNGKIPPEQHRARALDVRAVRGPLSRAWLRDHLAIDAPAVFGDPALLLPGLMPELVEWARTKTRAVAVVPNLHDAAALSRHPGFVDPRGPLQDVLRAIAQSEAVVGSSLHGVIVAESLDIPAVLVRPTTEPEFKYLDYARGTGRNALPVADSVADAARAVRSMGPARIPWDSAPLLDAFPHDLWSAEGFSHRG